MTKQLKNNIRLGVAVLLVLFAALSRLIPHLPNFTPIGAMALFGAAYFSNRIVAFAIPLISLWISDLLLNNIIYSIYFDGFVWFHSGFYWSYGSIILIGFIGHFILKMIKFKNVILASLSASLLFFIVSNFGVWMSGFLYTKDFAGLVTCYVAGVPFFGNMIMGDLFYSALLFGSYEFMQNRIPAMQLEKVR